MNFKIHFLLNHNCILQAMNVELYILEVCVYNTHLVHKIPCIFLTKLGSF
jgi:hypothetical protein